MHFQGKHCNCFLSIWTPERCILQVLKLYAKIPLWSCYQHHAGHSYTRAVIKWLNSFMLSTLPLPSTKHQNPRVALLKSVLWLVKIYSDYLKYYLYYWLCDKRMEVWHELAVDISNVQILCYHSDKSDCTVTYPKIRMTQERCWKKMRLLKYIIHIEERGSSCIFLLLELPPNWAFPPAEHQGQNRLRKLLHRLHCACAAQLLCCCQKAYFSYLFISVPNSQLQIWKGD